MRPPHLDFLHPARRRPRRAWALLFVGVFALCASGGQAQRLSALNRTLEAEVARQAGVQSGDARAAQRVGGADSTAAEAEAVRQASAVVMALDVPWDALFADLEAAARPGVVLTTLQPEADGRRLRIGGEATSFAQLTAYVVDLGRRPAMARVLLASHERVDGALRFTVTANWKGRP